MKNQKVIRINEKMGVYGTNDSEVGNSRARPHPLFTTLHPIPAKNLEEGDVVRCDGLPFLARPKAVLVKSPNSFRSNWYEPSQLSNGMWVLRKFK